MTDHWHGISLYGATDCVVINNTVVDQNGEDPGPPWIMIADHKDSTPSTGCIVRNNLAATINVSGQGNMVDHNIKFKTFDDLFVNYSAKDLHLKKGCAAIDFGSSDLAPPLDRDGVARPQGGGIDAGAYEYVPNGVIRGGATAHGDRFSFLYDCRKAVFSFGKPCSFQLSVFDVRGKCLFSSKGVEERSAMWRIGKAAAGTYFYRLSGGEQSVAGKMMVQ
jgi:hypothetical protein